MKIEVVAPPPEKHRDTAEFDKRPLEDAIKRLTPNYAYAINTKRQCESLEREVYSKRERGISSGGESRSDEYAPRVRPVAGSAVGSYEDESGGR